MENLKININCKEHKAEVLDIFSIKSLPKLKWVKCLIDDIYYCYFIVDKNSLEIDDKSIDEKPILERKKATLYDLTMMNLDVLEEDKRFNKYYPDFDNEPMIKYEAKDGEEVKIFGPLLQHFLFEIK